MPKQIYHELTDSPGSQAIHIGIISYNYTEDYERLIQITLKICHVNCDLLGQLSCFSAILVNVNC